MLREFLSPDEARDNWANLEDLSPHLAGAALAAEDRRFYSHHGVGLTGRSPRGRAEYPGRKNRFRRLDHHHAGLPFGRSPTPFLPE